jgi:transposase
MDNGSCHKAKALMLPPTIVCLFLPPSSPELNPIERLWRDLKDQLAWGLAAQLEELAHQVSTIIRRYTQTALQALTAFPYFVHAVHALYS